MKSKTNKRPVKTAKAVSKPSVGAMLGAAVELVKRSLTEGPDVKSATSLLTQQHEEVKALFKKLEAASARPAKVKLFEELARNLVAHDAIEREIFYPACEKALGMTDELGEALVEHGVVEFCLYQADQAQKGQDFAFKCQVLKEIVLHHAKEEERDFFPKVERKFGKAELERLGARMKVRFTEAKAEDFRMPLHDNLNQVLAGAMKPEKGGGKVGKKATGRPVKSAKARKAA